VPYRIHRIRKMLDEKTVFSIEDFKRMVNDQHSYLAALLTPWILRLKDRTAELSPEETTALEALTDWDYNMDPALIAPAASSTSHKQRPISRVNSIKIIILTPRSGGLQNIP
jgi:acyl-homoserine lactone acylase PvdQ